MLHKLLRETLNVDSTNNTNEIIRLVEEVVKIEKDIKTIQKNLVVVLVSEFENHSDYKIFEKKMLKMKLTKTTNKVEKKQLSLLRAICFQIVESIDDYHQYANDHSKALINHGARFYDVSHKSVMETTGCDGTFLSENIVKLNEFLKNFDVQIKISDLNANGFRINIRIFPEF